MHRQDYYAPPANFYSSALKCPALTLISAAEIGQGKLASLLVVTGMTKLSILNLRYSTYCTVTSWLVAEPHLATSAMLHYDSQIRSCKMTWLGSILDE